MRRTWRIDPGLYEASLSSSPGREGEEGEEGGAIGGGGGLLAVGVGRFAGCACNGAAEGAVGCWIGNE